jgi:hypothetical protein
MFKRLLPVVLALSALPAGATTTYVGTSQTSYNSAVSDLGAGYSSSGLVNFLGATSGVSVLNVGGTGVDFNGFVNGGAATLGIGNGTGSDLNLNTTSSPNTYIRIDFQATVYAVSLDLATGFGTKNWSYTMGSTSGTVSVPQAGTVFGVGGDAPPTSLTPPVLPGASHALYIQDFSVLTQNSGGGGGGGGAEAPEPSTLALMGSALISLPLLARHRTRKMSRS